MMISLISTTFCSEEQAAMANLIVRKLDPRIVDALKQRAALNGRSAEAEHRALLETVLLKPAKKSFTEALAAIPTVGRDEDFERQDDEVQSRRVFD
jgi:plasmid stability protein